MELKRKHARPTPSGSVLLIVPYGIETFIFPNFKYIFYQLLIVPYGIETLSVRMSNSGLTLLIVPYGIETLVVRLCVRFLRAFNRTLWN